MSKHFLGESLVEKKSEDAYSPALRQSSFWLKASGWSLIVTSSLAIAWLSFAKTDEVVVVRGKLEPVNQVQDIKLPLGGVTSEVLVKEGEKVKRGQVLLRLDSSSSQGGQKGIIRAIALKNQQIEEKEIELQRYLDYNDVTQSSLVDRINLQQTLVDKIQSLELQGASSEVQLLQEKNKLKEAQGQLKQAEVERLRQSSIYRQQIKQLNSELSELEVRRNDQSITLSYQEIRSPVDGVVFDLKPTVPGYVGQASEPILKIVPQTSLRAAVEIPSRQIGFVKVGQSADISIDSYPSTDFGVLPGTVLRVSSDALPPSSSETLNESLYPALVELSNQSLTLRNGGSLPLQAGMTLQAHIKLRTVSYIQLLIGRFRDKTESLRRL